MTEEHRFIAQQGIGSSFGGVYCVENVFVRKTKTNKDYQDMMLRDRSGSRPVKYWGVVSGLQKGDFVFIAANVEDYMGNPNIVAQGMEKADPPSDWSNYIPIFDDSDKCAASFDAIRSEIKRLEGEVGDETAGKIVDEVYGNSTFFQKFLVAPSSAKPYYGRQGGLLANTVRVAEQCLRMSESYSLNSQERLIMLASALLCRIGAIDAFEFQSCMPVETKKGMLLGMNNLTMTRVSSVLRRVVSDTTKAGNQLNQEVVLRMLHSISSCAGMPLKPMTKEAMVLVSVYRMDVEMVEAIEFMQNDVNASEEFTAYDSSLGRRYYVGCRTKSA